MIIEAPFSGQSLSDAEMRLQSLRKVAHLGDVINAKAVKEHSNSSTQTPEQARTATPSRRNSSFCLSEWEGMNENNAAESNKQFVLENGLIMKHIKREETRVGFQKYNKDKERDQAQQRKPEANDGRMSFAFGSPYIHSSFSPALQYCPKPTLLGLLSPLILSHVQLSKLGALQQSPIADTEQTKVIGAYSREERMERISKYKYKIQKWRDLHPVNRAFKGRSRVAGMKPRVKGRFVKSGEAAAEESAR